MKVTSVIVLYNGKQWIDKCIGSLLTGSITNDIVVVDNGSTDGGPDYIKLNFPSVNLIISNENLGFGKANNVGMQIALENDSDYVFLLNQDAWVDNNTIETLVQYSKKSNEFGVLSPIHLNGQGKALDFNFSHYLREESCPNLLSDFVLSTVEDRIYPIDFVNAAAWLITKECLRTVGGFNPLFQMYSEDGNYLDRMSYFKLKAGIVPRCFAYHDRVQRPKSEYYIDPIKLYSRNIFKKFCNPNFNLDLDYEIKNITKWKIKAFLKFDFVSVRKLKMQIEIIKNNRNDIIETHRLSKIRNKTFLN